MNAPVLPRLYAGGLPLLRAVGVLCSSFLFGVLVAVVRKAAQPIGAWLDTPLIDHGWFAYLLAGSVAAIASAAAAELRNCSFTSTLPGLSRRMARELSLYGVLTVLATFVLVLCAAQTVDERVWLASVASALGYTVGTLNWHFESRWSRISGRLSLLAATLPLFFLPEIARIVDANGPAGLVASTALLLVVTQLRAGGGASRSRDRSLGLDGPAADAAGRARSGVPHRRRFGSVGDGSASFDGARRSDRDWLRALLHQSYGSRAGGVIGASLRLAGTAVVLNTMFQLFFAGLDAFERRGATRGGGGTTPGFTGLSIESLANSLQPGSTLVTLNAAAILAVLLVTRSLPRGGITLPQPLSRERRARLEWQQGIVEEFTALVALLLAFAGVTLVATKLGAENPWPRLARWTLETLTVFALLPIARWISVRLLQGSTPTRDDRTQQRDLRWNLVFALCAGLVLGGAEFAGLTLFVLEQSSTARLWGTALALLTLIALGRVAWRWDLARFFARRDL